MKKNEINHSILGSFASFGAGEYQKQVNIVRWNDAQPVIDLRLWQLTKDGQQPLKGITFALEDAEALIEALQKATRLKGVKN